MTKEQWILYKALVAVENPNIEIAEGEQGLLDICNILVSRGGQIKIIPSYREESLRANNPYNHKRHSIV